MALCPSCGQDNPDIAKFCMVCATALDQESSSPAEERKVVSILFVDLVGFTARSHAADPEDVRAALGPYHALLKREIERFGGTVEKFIGDAVMAVFGAPVAHEDDAERAVRAALRITEAIAELNESNPALDLSIRAAVNTGEGLVALGARPEAGEGMVTGDVVNTASRLQNIAPVNGVVVGEITYRSTKDFIDYQALDPVTVKGKPDQVAVWRALSAKSRFGVDADTTPRTTFIGRDYELTTLKMAYQRAIRESSLQLVTIVGEPGVGKSRLLSEFSSFVDEQEDLIFWRQGRSLPYGEGITFWALGEIVKAHAGILESDTSEDASEKLRDAIIAIVTDTAEHPWFFSRLAPLVGVHVTEGGNPQKEESFTAWRRFLEAIAERGPLVLVFEDLHWADPSLLEFIEHLVDWVTGVPIFAVCTARPELYDQHPNWGGGKRNFNILSLSPLDDSETAQLISSLLSQAVLPAEIHATLLERAGGNPLYAEEFSRMLSDRGILTKKGRVLSLDQDVDIPMPESVQALIAARLDTLVPERKSLLHDASVAGKVFWSGAVAAIAEADGESVRLGLHELGNKQLVRPSRTSSMQGQQEYAFWHALIRDVCYNQIPRATRAEKHRAMAAWIETTAERLDDHAEVLTHHYSTALELAQASGVANIKELETQTRNWLIVAADRALKLDPTKALTLYRQALDLLEPDHPETFKVLREAARACRSLGLLSQAQDFLEQAITGLSARRDLSGEGIALSQLALVLRERGGSIDQSLGLTLRAIELLEQQPPGDDLVMAYRDLAFSKLQAGSPSEGFEWANKALDAAHGGPASHAVAEALGMRGLARCELGDIAGLEDLKEAIAILEAAGVAESAASSYNNLADLTWLVEGPKEALKPNKQAQSLARSHGYVHMSWWALDGELPLLYELGRWHELLGKAEELISWSREHGDALLGSVALFESARVLWHRTGAHRTLTDRGDFLSFFRGMNAVEYVAPCLALAALVHARTGDLGGAFAFAQEFELVTESAPYHRARYLPDVVRALCRIGKIADTERVLLSETNIAYARDRHAVITAQAIVAEATQELEKALRLYNEAARAWNEYGFVLEEGQAHLGAGRCFIGLGNTLEASSLLTQAREIFVKLGAKPLLDETDGYLGKRTALSS